jgi:demethoxyubiquinone hydroxylase (CLK1/Coq7/Cat5 family)
LTWSSAAFALGPPAAVIASSIQGALVEPVEARRQHGADDVDEHLSRRRGLDA